MFLPVTHMQILNVAAMASCIAAVASCSKLLCPWRNLQARLMTLLWFVHSQAWYRRACSYEALHDYSAACSNAKMAVKLSRYITPTLTCQACRLTSVVKHQASPKLVLCHASRCSPNTVTTLTSLAACAYMCMCQLLEVIHGVLVTSIERPN